MAKLKDPNPLNLFDVRKLKVPPRHFEFVSVPIRYNLQDSITKWIQDHLKGRFYVGKTLEVDHNNNVSSMLKIGFEDGKELSLFTLACPHLKY